MLTEEQRKQIGPEYCAEGLKKIAIRLGFRMEQEEYAAITGAISLLLDEPIEVWLFGERKENDR